MRILFLSWNFPPALGGIEYVVDHLYRGLKASGHTVKLLTARADVADEDEDLIRCPKSGLKNYVKFAFFEGRRVAKRLKPDVILNGSIASAPAAWMLSKLLGVPYIILMHGSDILYEGWIYQRIVRFLSRQADGLATNSKHTRDLLVEAGCKPERIQIIHPGVCVENFDSVPTTGAEELVVQAEGRKVLLSVGRLIKRKGILEFVEQVMPDVVKQYPEVLYYVVGDDATQSLAHKELMKDRIQKRVKELGLEKHVELLGKVNDADLFRLYFLADIFVLPVLDIPGDVEGFGIVFSEANLAGTANVATRSGGIPEAVQDGVTGLLADPGDFDSLTEHVCSLLGDEGRRRGMAEAGAVRARECFAWEVITREYADFCETILQR